MNRRFLSEEIPYTGRELCSLWAYRRHGLQGDSVVAFLGPCDVATEALVDEADRKEGAFIRSARMLHFIAEHFDRDLEKAILRQLLLVGLVQAEIHRTLGTAVLDRRGDDLFCRGRKLSVSIATLSPVSALIAARPLGEAVLEQYAALTESVALMRSKVRGVE